MDRSTLNRAPATPPENREDNGHYFTPAWAKVRGAVEFCDRMGIEYFKEDIFRTFNVSSQEGWKFLSDSSSSRRLHNDPDREEHRGRKPLISPEKFGKWSDFWRRKALKHDLTHGNSWDLRWN